MSITPAGQPVWLRANSHTTYGGNVNKANYQSQGVVNPKTDVGAEHWARIAADLEALGNVAPFGTLTYTQDDAGTNDPTVVSYEGMAGATPTGARQGNGDVIWTFPSAPTDAYGVAGTLNIVHAEGSVHGSTAGDITPDITAANVVRVRTWAAGGGALSDAKVTLVVSTGPA
jgi:hypothetical protein